MQWRWDQGRLDYFRFDMIKRIATVLCSLENADLRAKLDPLRDQLTLNTSLPFAPNHYKVWRNYKRVFGCCLLASEIDGRMICTELCHRIAAPTSNYVPADFYFEKFIQKFYYPSPVFEGYSNRGAQYFPVCAILKLLLARLRSGQQPIVTLDEIIKLLVANDCTGEEPIEYYTRLIPHPYSPAPDEVRQIRELVRFISQISALKTMNLASTNQNRCSAT